jgi:hypothetical protein
MGLHHLNESAGTTTVDFRAQFLAAASALMALTMHNRMQ